LLIPNTFFISIGLTKRISELQAATKKKNASTKNQKKKTAVSSDASSSALVESLGGGDPTKFIEFLIAQIQQKAAAEVASPAERRRKYFEKLVVGQLRQLLAAENIALKGALKKDDLVQLAVNCLQIKVPGMDDVSLSGESSAVMQVQQNAASESFNQALKDAAVDSATKADSAGISSSTDAATTAVPKDGEPIQIKLTAGDIFTLRIEEYIFSNRPTVRKNSRVLRIYQHPRLKRKIQIWYSYTWTAHGGVIHNEDDGVLDIVFENGMSN